MGNLHFPLQLIINFWASGPACLLDAGPSYVPAPGYLFGQAVWWWVLRWVSLSENQVTLLWSMEVDAFPNPPRNLLRAWPRRAAYDCVPDSVRSLNHLSSGIKSGNDLMPSPPTVRAFWCTLCACVSVTYVPQWNRFCFDTILVHDVILWLFYNNSQCKQTSLGFSNYYLWFLDIAALWYWRIPSFFQGHRMLTSVPASLSQQPGSGLVRNERCTVLLYTLAELIKAVSSPMIISVPWCSKTAKYGESFVVSFFGCHGSVQSARSCWIRPAHHPVPRPFKDHFKGITRLKKLMI